MTLFETGLILMVVSFWALVIIALLGKVKQEVDILSNVMARTNRLLKTRGLEE